MDLAALVEARLMALWIGLGVSAVAVILFALATCGLRRFAKLIDTTNRHKLD